MRVTAIIVAGGSGSRMGMDKNKAFLPLLGEPIIKRTVNAFSQIDRISKIIIVTRKEDIKECEEIFKGSAFDIEITEGGKTRQESVYSGLLGVDDGICLIHDAARALIEKEEIEAVIENVGKYGAAAVGVLVVDTLKRVDKDGFIIETIERDGVFRIQTPQGFMVEDIKNAHIRAIEDGFVATDDCGLYEKYIGRVKVIEGKGSNIKITYPEDLKQAEEILKRKRG